jgi:hypothetical protein
MKTNTKNTFIITLVLALIAIFGYGYLVHYVRGLTDKTSGAKDAIDRLEVELGRLKSLHNAATNTSDEKDKISSYIVQGGDSVSFITNMENLASSQGVQYATDKIETKNTPDLDTSNKELLSVTFSVQGNWSAVYKFLRLVESMPYAFILERVTLTTDKSGSMLSFKSDQRSSASSTTVDTVGSMQSGIWKMVLVFNVVKVKDN